MQEEFATLRMPLKKRKTIGQVDPRTKKLKQLRRQEQSRRLEMLQQRAPEAAQPCEPTNLLESDTDSTSDASSIRVPVETPGGQESECDGGAWGRLAQPAWECDSGGGPGTGLSSFVDSFSQSLQILGSRTVDDDAGVGVTADAAPPSAYSAGLPEMPYPAADPAGLRELQKAMGATDEEMAILQQLGGEGPIWPPVKIEVSPSTSMCVPKQEEQEEEKVDITDLDRQWAAPEAPPAEVCGEGGAAPAGSVGGPAASARPHPGVGTVRRQCRTRPAAEDGDGVERLMAGYEQKEMVCPACHRFFLGFSALQRHLRDAHDGDPDLHRRRKNHCSSVSASPEALAAAAASVLGAPSDAPSKLVCPLCRELVAGKDAAAAEDALAAHVAEKHPGSAVAIDSAAATLPPSPGDESVGLKTHISTALGGLLNRAFGSPSSSARRQNQKRRPPKTPPKREAPGTAAASESASSSSGRPRRIYDPERAMFFWQQMSSKGQPTEQDVERASARASAGGKFERYPFVCFYCECRFEKQSVRNMHTFSAHRSKFAVHRIENLASAEPEVGPEDASGSGDRDGDGAQQPDRGPLPGADREPPLWMFMPAKRGRPPGRSTAPGPIAKDFRLCPSGDEGVKRKAMEALRELDARLRRGRGKGRGRGRGRAGPRTRARAAAPEQEKTGLLPSQKREIEVVFVKEETSFPPESESPDGHSSARDPLSIEEEVGALPNAEFSFCGVQSIKQEVLEGPVAASEFSGCIKVDPDLTLEVEATENKVYSNL